MPVVKCQRDGKPGWKWGDAGHCYTYTEGDTEGSDEAKAKAHKQGAAARANMSPREKIAEGLRERRQS